MMPSFQSDGTCPVLQTDRKMEWSALATGGMANFRSSAEMPSVPGARPFFSLRMAATTSSRVGSSTDVNGCWQYDCSVLISGETV